MGYVPKPISTAKYVKLTMPFYITHCLLKTKHRFLNCWSYRSFEVLKNVENGHIYVGNKRVHIVDLNIL